MVALASDHAVKAIDDGTPSVRREGQVEVKPTQCPKTSQFSRSELALLHRHYQSDHRSEAFREQERMVVADVTIETGGCRRRYVWSSSAKK